MDQTVDLSYLSPEEYQKIVEVMKRDQDLKRQEDQRIFKLKAELQRLRKRGIIRQGALDPSRTCARCLIDLGCIVNRGADCPVCRKRVCKTCRQYTEGQQFVCLVCHKQTQLKAITGEWMREYTRTASGRFKRGTSSTTTPNTSPSKLKSSASDAISSTIKNTLRQTFLINQNHSSDSVSTGEQSVFSFASTSAQEDNHNEKPDIDDNPVPHLSSISSISIVKSLAKGFIPRLPPLDSLPPKSPPPKSPKSPKSPLSGGSHRSSTDSKEDSLTSPKLPPSPVIKALQSTSDHGSPPHGSTTGGNVSPQFQKQTVFRKVSNRMLESSSSEDEEEVGEPPLSPALGKEELHKTNSSGSTPSPRTPNSCRILSSIAANQATAFKFPPTGGSPIHSRPSSYERQSERQSSDEFSTPMSSFRSRSTSSEYYEESVSTDPRLTPQPLPRSRRVSPLRKQRAIAEELNESQRSSLEAEYGSCPSSAAVSAPDSGVADCNYSSPPKNFSFSSHSGSTSMTRSTSGNDEPFTTDSGTTVRESVASLSEGEAVVEKTTGYVFRKVTIKKRNSTPPQTSPHVRHDSPHHRSVDNTSTQRISTTNTSALTHDRPTTGLSSTPPLAPLRECGGPVERAYGSTFDGQQSHWNIGGESSASITHITGEVKHEKQEQQICAIHENNNIINKYDLIQKYEFEANSNSLSGIGANTSGTRLFSTVQHYDSILTGLGVRSRSYYYLYGSVTRCDACDACDKDMACERVNASALPVCVVSNSAHTSPANHNNSSAEQPGKQNSHSTDAKSIAQFCQNFVNEAFVCANQEIRHLMSITITDDNDINFVDLLIDSQQDITITGPIVALNDDSSDNHLEDKDLKTAQNICDFSSEESSEEESDNNLLNCNTDETTENLEEEYIEERCVSNLEKYYTQSLEEQLSDEDRRTGIPAYTHFASMSPFSDNEEWVDDNNHILDDSSAIDMRCSVDDLDLDLENGHISDGSTSSEEGLYSTPNNHYTRAQPIYGNPLAYSLHTIIEESCEESDRNSTRPSSPKSDSEVNNTESEKILNFSVSHNQCFDDQKRGSWCQSEADSVDSLSESEPAMSADFNETEVYLSSSRLEKYFTTGLLGSGAFDYPEDCEFADESDCDSSKPSLELLEQTNDCQQNATVFDEQNCDPFKQKTDSNKSEEQNNETNVNEVIEVIDNKHVIEIPLKSEPNSNKSEVLAIDEQNKDNKTLNTNTVQISDKKLTNESTDPSVSGKHRLQCDEEVKTFMTRLLSRMSAFNQINANISGSDGHQRNIGANKVVNDSGKDIRNENPLPSLKILESQIARLMEAVSPANLSASDSNSSYTSSSTIGSNNSDYGSDTLESDDEESKNSPNNDKRLLGRVTRSAANNSGASTDSTVSEETVYICKQLMNSLKKLTEIAFNDKEKSSDLVTVPTNGASDVAKARMYIRDQIVALMHTVKSSSPNSTPPTVRDRKSSQTPFNHQTIVDSDTFGGDSSDCGECSPKMSGSGGKKKTPSESGSETTCSASISIPSYDDSDHTPTESEISHEMEELFALLDSSAKDTLVLNETNLIGIAARPSSDEDRASLKSWEARISLFGKLQAAEDQNSEKPVSETNIVEVNAKQRTLTPNKSSEITVNGKEIIHKMSSNTSTKSSLTVKHQSSATDCCNSSTAPILIPIGHKTVVKIEDSMNTRTESLSPLFDSLKDRSFSSDSVSSVQTVKARFGTIATASASEISSDGTQSTSRLAIDEVDDEPENDSNLTSNSLRKSFNAKEKASSEDNLLVANLMTTPAKTKPSACTTKSAGNISELETTCNKSAFRDTGYYSFKSSEESIKSLDDSSASALSTGTSVRAYSVSTLPHMKHLKSETIEEVDEECVSDVIQTIMSRTMPQTKRLFTPSSHTSSSAKIHSFSSPNIPEDVFNGCRSSSLPLNHRSHRAQPTQPQPSIPHRNRSSFFSTSGVLRKLTALRGDDNSFRASPRRLRERNRNPSGGKDGVTVKRTGSGGVPQISVSDYSESFSNRGSLGSSDGQSTERHDSEENVENVFAYHSRSQTSLSSFGARSESLSSVYSAAGGGRYGSVVVTGEILFSISYNYKAGAMEVYIRECRNLAPVDIKRMRSDPYVKVYLLPDRTKSGKRKTKVKKHTLNPVFEEVLKFYMTISEVETRDLWLSVWHSDMFGRNDFLGEVTLPLGHEVFETPGLKWYPLQERLEICDNQNIYRGDIFLALKYTPPEKGNRISKKFVNQSVKGELHVLIKEAHNLTATRSNGTSDPFCKSYLLPDKSKSGKQKTPVIKKTCNPKWNHTFVFDDISIDELKERCLELTIWDYDKITSNDFLGGVRLSLGIGKYEGKLCDWMDSIGDEIGLWQQMLDRPNMWVYGELHLRSSMQTRRS